MIVLTVIILAVSLFGKYTDTRIHASATTILEDRLKPVPLLSHRFDYYGTYIQGAFITSTINIDTLLAHKADIVEARERTDKEWKAYLATYLVPEEDSVAHIADKQMEEIDNKLDAIFSLASIDKTGAQKLLEQSKIKDELSSITDKVNWLTDLQTRVGQEETVKMLSLISVFDNFMIGSLALAVILLGSIIFSAIRERKESAEPKKKAATKKTPAKVDKSTSKKKPVKKQIKK
jgi:hypothetical protein